jgi:hypothetical protein
MEVTNFVNVVDLTNPDDVELADKLRKLYELLILLHRLANTSVILQLKFNGRQAYIEAYYCAEGAYQGDEETSRAILEYNSFIEMYDVPSEILEMCLRFIKSTTSTMEPEQVDIRNCLYTNYPEEKCDLDIFSKTYNERKLLDYVRMSIYEDEIPEFLLKSEVRQRATLLCNSAFAVPIPNKVVQQILWFLE